VGVGGVRAVGRYSTRLLASVLTALAFAPGAAAWTTLATGVQKSVVPSMIVTQAGTELVSFDTPTAGTISVSRNRALAKVVVTNDPSAGRSQLVEQPDGAIQLYFPNAQGVARLTSTDDGQTWTGPIQTQSQTVGGVIAAAVAPDGTPYFAQDAAGLSVFRGLDGETSGNVFSRCCAYAESLAVDTAGLVQIAFYSNADADGTFLHERLAPDLSVAGSTPLKPTATFSDRVPLIADRSGFTFLAWAPGRPPTGVTVVPFREGQPAGDGVFFPVDFGDLIPHMALAADSRDRLWAIWTNGDRVSVTRSRSHGEHFGAVVTTRIPATAEAVSAVALPGTAGNLDVVVNTGTTLVEHQLRPGLSVLVRRTTKKKVVTRWAQALDDGVPVPVATFRIAGRTIHANAQGRAKVPRGSGKAAAPGYAGASFHVP
jgi:hypothetical protein